MKPGLRHAIKVALLATALAIAAGPATSQRKPATAKEQVAFGIEMAQRGLWSEALFRFEQASKLAPESPSILNNLAVAHEALGLFDEALALYRKALELAPADRGLKRNYSRFVEFYQSFKPPEEDAPEAGSETPTAGAGDGADSPRLEM